MATRQIPVERFSITTQRRFDEVVAAIDAAGWASADFSQEMAAARSFAEMTAFIERGLGTSGLMEFARYDLGAVLRRSPVRQRHGLCGWSSAIRWS